MQPGLEGREAAAKAAEPPQSPVFCGVLRRKKCAQILLLKNSSLLLPDSSLIN
jgi:hypothetical protein